MACFAVVVAALARTREQAVPVGISVVFLLAAPGGLWWPFFDQPKWLQTIGQGAMTTWSMFAIQDVILRDQDLAEVPAKLAILIAYGLVSFVIGVSLFRYRDGRRV
jgi:hypothetical protein